MNRKLKLFAIVVLLGAIAGCVDMDSTLSIDENGELHEWQIDIVFHDSTWEMLEMFAQFGGYDSVEEMILEDDELDDEVEEEEDHIDCEEGAEQITVNEDEQRMTAICTAPIITDSSLISVELSDDGDTVTYRDSGSADVDEDEFAIEDGFGFEDDSDFGEQLPQLRHTVVMPGEITDTNAHEVDGQRATWNLLELEDDELYAESGTEEGLADDDGASGFTVVGVLVALLAVLAFALRRR